MATRGAKASYVNRAVALYRHFLSKDQPASEMHGEPNCRRRGSGPGHAMPAMGWQKDPVAVVEPSILAFAVDPQSRSSLDEEHPLIGVLVVPLTLRNRLTSRDDALDAQVPPLDKQVHDLVGQRARRQIEAKAP